MLKRILPILISLLTITVAWAQPANDDCANATAVTVPTSGNVCVNGTLVGATDDGQVSPCETTSQEVWFTYVTTGANNIITVTPSGANPATNLVVSASSFGCGSTGINDCNAATTANGAATVNWGYPVGTQVWVFISSAGGNNGTFQLCITSTTTPPTTGKDCSTAVPICNLNSFTAAVTPGANGFQPPCFTQAVQQPTFYQFTVGQTGLLNWLATPSCGAPHANATEFDWAVYDITNGCPGTVVACDYNYSGVTTAQGMQGAAGAGCNNSTITLTPALERCVGVTVTAGRTYIIMVDQYTTGNSCNLTFDFTGSTFLLAPTSQFTAAPASACGSLTTSFTNTSIVASSYHWNFGQGPADTLDVQSPPSKTYSTPGTYLVSLTTTSASGCTDVASQPVYVYQVPTVSVNNATACPGSPASLTATPTTSGGTYLWSPGGYTTQTITVSPATTTTYSVTYTSPYNCTATATGTVTLGAGNFTVNAGNDTVVCSNQAVMLHGSVTPAGSYTYQWTPAGTLTGATTLTPTAIPTGSTDYILSVTNAGGCTKTDTVHVGINGVAIPVTATVTPSIICPGQLVQLDLSTVPSYCDINYTGCSGTGLLDSVGNGFNYQPGNGQTNVTIYGNFTKSLRIQMLYTAAELQAALGPGGGSINQLGWQIAVFNSGAILQNFTIRMGCTSNTTLTGWEPNLRTVFTPKNVGVPQNYTGWILHSLDSSYNWDGVSNIIVEVCIYCPNTSGNLNNIMVYTNSPNSTIYSVGAADQCAANTAYNTSAQRPKIEMNICRPNYSNYTINWTPNTGTNAVSNASIKNPTANPMGNQTYTVSVSAGGCAGSAVVSVSIDTSAKVNAGPDKTFCLGNNVALSATPSGTPQPGNTFSYQWTQLPNGTVISNAQNTTVTPSTTTTYVVAMAGGYCTVYDTITLTRNYATVSNQVSPITCNGANDGKIFETATGTSPFAYTWSANAATGNIDSAINLGPATYYTTVTDAQGCVAHDTITLTQPTAVTYTQTVTNVSCNGGSNGSITVTPSGGSGSGYSYTWSNAAPNSSTNSGLAAGNYTVTIHDGNGCSVTGSFTITEPTALTFGNTQLKDVRCHGGNDGFIIVSLSGGTGAYTYSWSHNLALNQPNATALTAGNYTVIVTDANACTVSASFTVSEPASGVTFNAPTVTDATCYGSNNGSATVNPTGGATPYTYLWDNNANNQTTQTATTLIAQTYSVTVTDDSLCPFTTTVTVNQPLQIQIAGTVTDVQCFGQSSGAVNITITNGVTPFTYLWSDNSTNQNLLNVPQGGYSVTVTDNTSCTASTSFTVNEPAQLVLNTPVITNVSCFGGSDGVIAAQPSGGIAPYNFTWSPGGYTTDTITGLSAGTYNITLSDANSCSVTDAYQVTEPAAALAFSNVTVVDLLCNGASTGSISVTVTGGTSPYTYGWSQNANLNNPVASSLAAGIYTVTVIDNHNCTVSSTDTVHQPTPITFGAPIITNVSCNGNSDGSAQVTPSGGTGGYTYTWNGVAGNNPNTGITANTYTVVVTDANACSASTSVQVTEPTGITVTPAVTNVSCFQGSDGSIDAVTTGGTSPYTYAWNDAQVTEVASNLSAGLYSVIVTDAHTCSTSASATVTEPGLLTVSATSTQVSCSGGSDGTITATAQGGTTPYQYDLQQNGSSLQNNSTGAFISLQSGTYNVMVTDDHQCTANKSIVVASPVADVYTLTTDSTSCYGAQYNDGAIHVEGTTIINEPYSYGLDGGTLQYSGDFFNVSAGVHDVLGVNNFGCTTHLQAIVPEPADASAEVLPSDTTVQLGESVQLNSSLTPYSSSAIKSYSWSPSVGLSCIDCPNPVLTPYNRETQYQLTITYNDHCVASAAITVIVDNKLDVFIPNSFSPNGDGNNDIFQVYGQGIKTVDLKVFNRWGILVFETTNQFDGWDGTYKGVLQSPGVYVYEVKITYLDNKEINKGGSITLIR